MTEELKPCPFCGGIYQLIDDPSAIDIAVVCNANDGGCGSSSGHYRSQEEAIKYWNKRSDNSL